MVWWGSKLQSWQKGISNWLRWLQSVFNSNLGSNVSSNWVQAYVAVSCWYTWKTRCEFVFNQVPINPTTVLMANSNSVSAFSNALSVPRSIGTSITSRERQVLRWTPPTSPFLKVNVDASWSKSTKTGFAGVVMRAMGGGFHCCSEVPVSWPRTLRRLKHLRCYKGVS